MFVTWTAAFAAKVPELLVAQQAETAHPLYVWSPADAVLAELVHERARDVATIVADGASVTLTLAPLSWHDGEPLVGADVCATLDRARSAERPTPWTELVRARISGCTPDPEDMRRVVVTFTRAPRDAAAWLDFPLAPAHDAGWTGAGPQSALAPIGLGPYAAERDGEVWHLTGTKRAPLKRLDVVVTPDPVGDLLAGRGIGAVDVAPEQLASVRAEPELVLTVEPATTVWSLMVNPTRGPLGQLGVRQALDQLVDREALAVVAFGADPELEKQPWTAVAGPWLPNGGPSGVPVTTRDPEAAERALLEAGLVRQGGRWTWAGAPVALKIAVPADQGLDAEALGAALASQLDGFGVEVTTLGATTWWSSLLAGKHAAIVDLALLPVDPTDLAAVFHSRSGADGFANPFGWSDPALDTWLAGGDPTDDDELARLVDQRPALFLWAESGRSAWRAPHAGRASLSAP